VLEIQLFGGFSVQFGGEPLPPLPSRTARSLFAYLALHAGHPQARTLLAHRFWPDATESRARRRLSHALWQVQDALGELAPGNAYLLTPGDTVLFDASAAYWLDVEEFEQRLDRVDAAGGVDAAAMRELRRCVELYHGDLLAGAYEPWAVDEQARLGQRYVTALGRLIEGCKQRGNFDEALTLARRLTHQEPLREDAHREVMRLCVLLGRPSQAMEQYERCRSVLLEGLDTEPAAQTTELYLRIARTRDVTGPRSPPAEELVSRRLVGRDDERVALVDQLERTLAGASGMVFVEGEPGVGKTQLLTQAAEDASWRGFRVLWGTCHPDGVAYGAIRQALARELDAVRVAQLRARISPVLLEDAAQLLPPLERAGVAPALTRRPREEHALRMREALTGIIGALATLDPVLIVIEDAHRADSETLDLLRTLSQRDHGGRLLTVVSFRDLEARATGDVWTGLRGLDRDARPVRLALRPLSAFETTALLAEVLATPEVPAAFAGAVHRESGGNPLYALELLRALRDEGALTGAGDERLDHLTVPVTDGLRSVIDGRLAHLDPEARALVELGAVLGAEFPLVALQAGSQLPEVDVTARLGEFVRRNLVDADGEACRFTHAATRRVVLDGLDPDRRRALHERAATALESTHPDRVEALAAHLQQADLPNRALPYLRQAARRAMDVHAYATAATHLRAAANVLDRVPVEVGERFDLLADLEEVLGVLGRRDEQAGVLAALEPLATGDPARRTEAALRHATYLGHVDRFVEARQVAGEAVEIARGRAPSEHGRALIVLGRVMSWAGDNAGAIPVLSDAADLLADAPDLEAEACFALGTALRFVQRADEARQALQRSLALAEEHDDRRGIVQALGALADVHAEAVRTDQAVATYERAIQMAREIGYRHREGVSMVNLGTVRLVRAEPGAALAAYDQAARIFDELGNHRGLATVQLNRAWLQHRWLGDDAPAETDAEAALRYFEGGGNPGSTAVCLETLAAVARRRGDLELAGRHLEAALAAAREGGEPRAEAQVLRSQVELAIARDDLDAAGNLLDTAERLVTELELVEFAAELRSLRSLVLARAGDHEAAWKVAQDALEQVAAGAERHRIHHRVAQVAHGSGRSDEAERHHVFAFQLLQTALADLGEAARDHSVERVAEHRAIAEAGRGLSPRELTVRLASRDAPRGRALTQDDVVDVHLEFGPPPDGPAQRARQILQVLDQAGEQGAEATLDDLAEIFDVSVSTVRRDLRWLRQQGHGAATRGTGTG